MRKNNFEKEGSFKNNCIVIGIFVVGILFTMLILYGAQQVLIDTGRAIFQP